MVNYEDRIKKIFDEVFENSTSGSIKESVPYQILAFGDDIKEKWYFDPVKKYMVKVCNHTEIVQISIPDENNKVLVRGPGCFLYVPLDDVEDIGFN